MMMRDEQQWARQQFGQARLGDRRRTERLVQTAAGLARKSYGTLPRSFPKRKDLKGAYRLLANPAAAYDRIVQPHCRQTRQAMGLPGEYLLIEDPTSLDFTGRQVGRQLGRIGDDRGQGLWLDSNLVLTVHGYDRQQNPRVSLLGLFDQQYWLRTDPPHKGRETPKQRLSRPRESQHWAAALEKIGPVPAGVRWTYIADRESDVYETFLRCQKAGVDFIIRANNPRALAQDDQSTLQKVAAGRPLGTFSLHLRARPGQAARTARLQVRAAPVTLRPPYRPDQKLEPFALWVVEAREIHAPADAKPLHWVLLTNRPAPTFAAALRIVKTYACRFLIEEYHKALKSGMHIEDSQLDDLQGLQALLAIHAVTAVRLVQLKHSAVQEPEAPLEPGEVDEDLLAILAGQYGLPAPGWTHETVLKAIAQLGGFQGRKGDGMPGWQTLWRGWQELMTMLRGYRLAKGMRCG